jgi:hypothetical protein
MRERLLIGVAGTGHVELAPHVLAQAGDQLVEPRVERATADLLRESQLGPAHGRGQLIPDRDVKLAAEQLPEQGEVFAQRLLAGAQLARDDGANVCGDQDLKALLARGPGAYVGVEELGQGVEQLRGVWAVLRQAVAPISSSMSHSGSQIRRPSEASSWLRRTPLR